MEPLCDLINQNAKECVEALVALQAVFKEVALDPSSQAAIYGGITENVKKFLEKAKSECTTPLSMWRRVQGSGTPPLLSLTRPTSTVPPLFYSFMNIYLYNVIIFFT